MISKTIRKASGTVTKAAKPAPRTPAPVNPGGNVVNKSRPTFFRSHGLPPSGVRPEIPTPVNPGGVGMTGFKNLVGAGMAPVKRSPMGSIKNAVGQAVAAKKASDATNRSGKSMLGSMMKKGGKVKAAKASAPKASSASK